MEFDQDALKRHIRSHSQSILVEGTLHGPDKMIAAKAAGAEKAREVAHSF